MKKTKTAWLWRGIGVLGVSLTGLGWMGERLWAQDKKEDAEAVSEEVYSRKWSKAELEEVLDESKVWLKGDIGTDQIVPPPWTPMEVEGSTIRSWGKEYRYEDSILPVSIKSLDRELLDGRTLFLVEDADGKHVLEKAEVTVEQKHDGLVQVKSVANAGGYQLELVVDYEFDGMGKVHMTLSGEGKKPERLLLEFPLNGEHSQMMHYMGSRSGVEINGKVAGGAALPPMSDSVSIPEEGIFLDAFRELLWIGDQRVGFTWFADSFEGWSLKDEKDIQVIGALQDGVRKMRIKFADRPFELTKPLQLVFGIQATPMRPRAKDFRSRVGWDRSDKNPPFSLQWRWGDGYYYPFQDTFPAEARKDVEDTRAGGQEILPTSSTEYYGMYRFSKGKFGLIDNPGLMHRDVMIWKEQWDQMRSVEGTTEELLARKQAALKRKAEKLPGGKSVEELLALPRHTAPGEDWYGQQWKPTSYPERFCFNSTFKDFYVWKLRQLVKDTSLNSLYLDQQMYQCANPDHGCGFVDYKGDWAAHGNLFAIREMVKRMYITMYLENGRAPELMWHSSYQVMVPAISFTTIFWDGEKYTQPGHFRSIVGQEFYSSFLDEAVLQIQHLGLPFGFIGDFLPQITRAELRGLTPSSPSPATARDMMGMLMIHDSHVDGYSALTYHRDLVAKIQNTRLSYPLDDMDVLYYWEAAEGDKGVKISHENVKPILHYNQDQAVLILFNWGDETLLAEAKLDPAKLGVSKNILSVKDALTDQVVQVDGGQLKVDLLPRDFRMLEIQWEK